MKNILVIAIGCIAICTGCSDAKKSTTETAATEEGWVSLFDGKTTTGWHSYGKTAAGQMWKVADSALYLDTTKKEGWQTSGGGDILTENEYENFHLKLDWKIAANGNSGIIFYIHEVTAKYQYVWQTGPEMQVLDNNGHPDAKITKHRAGDLYDLISANTEAAKPVGEWNAAEIISKGGKLDFVLNGITIVSTTMWNDNWKKLIAGSKFKEMPAFGTYQKGKIALQDHGNMVWYKNIKIKKL